MELGRVTAAQALSLLGSSDAGLTAEEARRRLAQHGPNRIRRRRAEPAALKLLRQFTHLFALVLWVGAGLCVVAAWGDPRSGMMALAGAIVAVLVVNGVFSFLQEERAARAVAALRKLLPPRTRVLRAGAVAQVDARELVPGDVVVLEAGDQVPADCLLLTAAGVRVNTSALTGEAEPEPRDATPGGDEDDPMHARAVVLAGTFLVSGRARALVYATGMATQFGRIAELSQAERPPLSPLQQEIGRLARLISLLATGLGAAFFLLGHLLGLATADNLLFAIGTIVANVPEGLLPTVTLSLAMASQRMARRKALVRKLPAVETLGSATVICTDKTGTLTQNRMQITALHLGGKLYPPGRELAARFPALFEGAALCQDLVEATGGRRGDPMELSLAALGEAGLGRIAAERIAELPFDAERRRLTTLHRARGRLVLHTKGAFETVLPLCTRLQSDGSAVPLGEADRARLLGDAEKLAGRGLRVLAFATGEPAVPGDLAALERNLTLSGLVAFQDPPRPEVPAALDRCRDAGIRVIMVTGDHPRTAVAVAREIRLVRDEPAVITGAQLRGMDDAALSEALSRPEVIVARADPADKSRIVAALQRAGEVVAVTGDGANDAPALRAADIGIAMGLSGTDVARDAADLVLLDDNFASIVAAIEEGRAVFANIRKFMTYILTSNVPELVPYLAFVLLRVPLAMTILQILAVDLGTDIVPALALGAEAPERGIMLRPPRRRGERLFDRRLLARAYLWLGAMEATAAMAAFFAALHRGGWTPGAPLLPDDPLYLRATTACLAAVVIMQVTNLFLCRSETESLRASGLRGNPLLGIGVACELGLLALIVYTPPGRAVFGGGPLGVADWLYVLPFAAGMMVLEELRKAIARRLRQGKSAAAPTTRPPRSAERTSFA